MYMSIRLTFNFRFHVCQEALLLLRLWKLLLSFFLFCCISALLFSISMPFIVDMTGLKHVDLKFDCDTMTLPRSSTFHTGNARVSVILLDVGILS